MPTDVLPFFSSLIDDERERIVNSRDNSQGFNYDEYNTYEDVIMNPRYLLFAIILSYVYF